MLELDRINITLAGKPLFPELSCMVKPAEIVTVMGASGCGKSTLLAAISGCLAANISLAGKILLNGKELTHLPVEKREIGILFQENLLFPHMDVYANLAFAIPAKFSKEERKAQVARALNDAQLSGYENRDVATLSGGQKARISLLRSLLARPKALLLDEPFSKLDQELKQNFRSFLKTQITTMNIPVILVTHDADDIMGSSVIDLETGLIRYV